MWYFPTSQIEKGRLNTQINKFTMACGILRPTKDNPVVSSTLGEKKAAFGTSHIDVDFGVSRFMAAILILG